MDIQWITFRAFGCLNDFLKEEYRSRTRSLNLKGHPSVKDAIEAQGIPHTEIDLILVNNLSVSFSHHLQSKDKLKVYPSGYLLQRDRLKRLYPKHPRTKKFILDVHLGKLAKYMRILGLDTVYKNDFEDSRLIDQALKEKRIILTCDRGILKQTRVTYGHWLRSRIPEKQLKEVLTTYQIFERFHPFSRCIQCNSKLLRISKQRILNQLPEKVREHYQEFSYCRSCQKPYWQGSHLDRMHPFIKRFIKESFKINYT